MYKNGAIEGRIDELLAKMTLKEKVGQLRQVTPSPVGGFEISPQEAEKMFKNGDISRDTYDSIINGTMLDKREEEVRQGFVGSFIGLDDPTKINHLQKIAVEQTRLGIPLIFGMDVIHGLKTIFPSPLAEACSFNDFVFEKTAQVAAKESSEVGINWTYSPMVDIGRDARWGRVVEGAGEDPYLSSRFATAKVRGYQGEDNDLAHPDHIAACVKHFAAYGAVEGGRDYDNVDVSLPKLYETYFPPYKAAIKQGAATVMAAFNDISGEPCTSSKFLLKEVLRDEWGFDGMVISDASGINELKIHGTAADDHEGAKQAIEAGCDMDLGGRVYNQPLIDMVEKGMVDIKDIDCAVRNILRIKFALGLFEKPYTQKESTKMCAEYREIALDASRRSIVLLKNENTVLPLKKGAKITVVGSIANDRDGMFDSWVCSVEANTAVSLVDGLKNLEADFKYTPCVSETEPLNETELLETVKGADVVIAALSFKLCGEATSCCNLALPGEQQKMLDILATTNKPVVALLFNGRPIDLTKVLPKVDALVECWLLGTEAGNAIADVLYNNYNPSGRLCMTFPHSMNEWPNYYSRPTTGRPASDIKWCNKYADTPITPMFCFGSGLSYTEFKYSDIRVEKAENKLNITVTVKNIGDFAGEETVQLYIHRKKATRIRPRRELKGFAKVFLDSGEAKDVTISVTREELGYYNMRAALVTDESEFDIWMAHDSSCGEHTTVVF